MANEKKHTLITLSLAGAIGYYLYNKLMKFNGIATSERTESAHERTKRELEAAIQEDLIPTQPEIFEEPQENIFDEEYTPVNEDVFAEEPADEVYEEEALADVESFESQESVAAEDDDAFEDANNELIDETASEKRFCEECGAENNKNDRFCQTCGATMIAEMEIEEFEPATIAPPVLEFTDMNFDTPVSLENSIEPEEIDVPAVEDDIEDDIDMEGFDENAKDTDVEDLFSAMEEEPKLMDNVEPLHKVDAKDAGAKQEYKSIMDFFNTL